MILGNFIQSVYYTLTQQGGTALIGDDSMLAYARFALSDIYTYKGKGWTFMYETGIDMTNPTPPAVKGGKFAFQTTLPIYRLKSVWDKELKRYISSKSGGSLDLKSEDSPVEDWKPGSVYYKQYGKEFKFYENLSGYVVSYLRYFELADGNFQQEIPLPDIFLGAMHSFMLSYAHPQWGQSGENREAAAWAKGIQQLDSLTMTDSIQNPTLTMNIA